MWKMQLKTDTFKTEAATELIVEDCPHCARKALEYPKKWNGAVCPSCKKELPGSMIINNGWGRKHYHFGLTYSAVGKILCTE